MSSHLKMMSLSLLAASLLISHAQTNPPAPDLIQKIKQPVSWLNWGGDLRIRNEYFNNLLTLNPNSRLHEQDYFRFRARIWTTITPADDFSFFTRLATEPRDWLNPAGYSPYKGRTGMDMTEGVFDALNVRWKNILQQPATVTVGRQDIFLGDGWLVGEGTPYDGSWTTYLDSARFTYELKEQHTVFEAIGIIQDAYYDGWLPTLNNQNRIGTEQNVLFGLRLISENLPPLFHLQFAFKINTHQQHIMTVYFDAAQNLGADNRDIFMIGDTLDFCQILFTDFALIESHSAQINAAIVHGQAVALGSDKDIGAELVHLLFNVAGHGAGQCYQRDDGGYSDHQADGQKGHLGLASFQVVDGDGVQLHQKYLAPPFRSLTLTTIAPPLN